MPLLTLAAWERVPETDEGWASVSPAGSFLKRSKPDFDPRSYGATKFSDLLQQLAEQFRG
ncbi:MAG: OST-HTH/LOTUS domain-containing protein [Rheinheimera sp.]|nr:OST-HTH/LOTUS domain-containing protein [Rheinheimera sp.]